ncbi:UDP-N-acetylmuramate dehydrogenase [Elusimicrobiota bacterium]
MRKIDNADMKGYSGFGCGGKAEALIEVENNDELQELHSRLESSKTCWTVLGYGYNTLISDEGIAGAVIRLVNEFMKIHVMDDKVISGSGADLSWILKKSVEHELSGLEFLTGIPGTVGGALCSNAGIRERCMADCVHSIEVFDTISRDYLTLFPDEIGFDYRSTSIPDGYVITQAVFKLQEGSGRRIQDQINRYMEERTSKQPLMYKSCGCVFKNPKRGELSAAGLIQEAGLKGLKIGDAQVSDKHANFIVNTDKATSQDIWKLICVVRQTVMEKCDCELELELKLLGEGFKQNQ